MENKINMFSGLGRSESRGKYSNKSSLSVISITTLIDSKNDKDIFNIGKIHLLILSCE